MPKEWILNSATNRFHLNFKKNVGATSEAIRKCEPKSLKEWQEYYYSNVRTEKQITQLGQKLYVKISEVLTAEIEEITEQDCIDYIKALVIDRTYDGYVREINTIYGQLQEILGVKISPAPDKWDRLYNVDFYIEVNNKYIGLQIKPVSKNRAVTEMFKERTIQQKTHREFQKKYGGKVFYIFSANYNYKKFIANTEVINEIIEEIQRLNRKEPN